MECLCGGPKRHIRWQGAFLDLSRYRGNQQRGMRKQQACHDKNQGDEKQTN
jgi:hypothetical protein